ncbi:putative retrotransposon hot spot protein (RHS,) [Trypanosoma cruzi]|uniref:Putative retrotransposon hot spot protein (RHS,) n=1 Tax=Trypanosoma cruzi TaxID=5693 RepID=A0A2V2V9C1_TRYCR|nr:putative retrotransposon hot spot protein (RHS,) [Trypanosoma cruzi]
MHTADIFHKACKLHSFLLFGELPRCIAVAVCMICAPCVWPWLHRILLQILCVFSCVRVYVPTSSCRVCAVTAVPQGCGIVASRMREQTLRAHHVVVVGSHQHCVGWMAPARLRCGGPRAYGVHRILCRHTVWVSLLFWLRFMTVPIVFLFLILRVGWLLFRSNSN